MKTSNLPEAEYLKSVLEYRDGSLFWKTRPVEQFSSARVRNMWNAKFAETRAGRQMPGGAYRQVMVDGVRYLEHRLVAQMFGLDTQNFIDHIDGDGLNNRVENLRPATQRQNTWNNSGWRKKASRVGIHQKPNGRWIAFIRDNGSHRHLGTFLTESGAIAAREAAEAKHYGDFARAASLALGGVH